MRAVGWVRIALTGALSGRRLNALAQRMPMRRVQAVRGGMEMDVRARDLNELRRTLRGAGIHMRIVRRYGVVRVRRAARRRSALVVAAVCTGLLIWGLMQTVFGVTVMGAKDAAQQQEMLALMEECGVRPGIYAGSVERERIAEEVMRRFSGLTYATVRRRGLQMELYVVQATQAPEVYDPNIPVDVVAAQGGLVTKVVALSGEALVRPGDTVVEGQVLIAGTERMPHARGAVTARVWSTGKGEADLRTRQETRTGRTYIESFMCIGDWRFPEAEEEGFEEEQVEEERFALLDGLFYPAEIVRRTHYEVEVEQQARKISAVKDESGARALTNALLALPNGACVVDKRVEYSMIKDGKLCAAVTLESVMQIGEDRIYDSSPVAGE